MEKKSRLLGLRNKQPKKRITERSENNKQRQTIRSLQKENKRLRAENRDIKRVLQRNLQRLQDNVEHKTLEEILEEIQKESELEDILNGEAEEQ